MTQHDPMLEGRLHAVEGWNHMQAVLAVFTTCVSAVSVLIVIWLSLRYLPLSVTLGDQKASIANINVALGTLGVDMAAIDAQTLAVSDSLNSLWSNQGEIRTSIGRFVEQNRIDVSAYSDRLSQLNGLAAQVSDLNRQLSLLESDLLRLRNVTDPEPPDPTDIPKHGDGFFYGRVVAIDPVSTDALKKELLDLDAKLAKAKSEKSRLSATGSRNEAYQVDVEIGNLTRNVRGLRHQIENSGATVLCIDADGHEIGFDAPRSLMAAHTSLSRADVLRLRGEIVGREGNSITLEIISLMIRHDVP